MKIIEMKGTSHVYTLNDGTTFRIYARKAAIVKDELISDEMRRAEKLRILRFIRQANSQPAPAPFEDNSTNVVSETPSDIPMVETPTIPEDTTTNANSEVTPRAEETTTTTKKSKKSATTTKTTDEGSEK